MRNTPEMLAFQLQLIPGLATIKKVRSEGAAAAGDDAHCCCFSAQESAFFFNASSICVKVIRDFSVYHSTPRWPGSGVVILQDFIWRITTLPKSEL